MARIFFLFSLFTLSFTTYGQDPLTIVHTKFYQNGKFVDGSVYGTLHMTGLLDRSTGPFSRIEFRTNSSLPFQPVTPTSSPVSSLEAGFNFRRVNVNPVTTTGIEFRICGINEPCSVPYEFKPQILFGKFIETSTTKNGYVTPFSPNLRFQIYNHSAGNARFQIGKLGETGTITYTGYQLATTPKGCPEAGGDPFACEVKVPSSLFSSPGIYTLSATTDYGSSQNTLQFSVVSAFSVYKTVPEIIHLPSPGILTFFFGGPGKKDLEAADIRLTFGRCQNAQMPVVGMRRNEVTIQIPRACLPQSGSGEFVFDVHTQAGAQVVRVPYDFK